MNPLKARNFAIQAHHGQKYGQVHPYEYHLDAVVSLLLSVGYDEPTILMAAYLHDVLEDTAATSEDLRIAGFPEDVIRGVQFCTDEPGLNRKDRKSKTYARVKVSKDPIGVVVKFADRIANMQEGAANNPKLFAMYQRESEHFLDAYLPEGGLDDRFQALLHFWPKP